MAMKKKGTPEKIKVVPDVDTLEKFKKLIEKSTGSNKPFKIVKESKEDTGK